MGKENQIEYVTIVDPKLTPDPGRIVMSSPEPEKEAEAS